MSVLHRIKKLQAKLEEFQVDAVLISNPEDIYYLTGYNFSSALFIVSFQSCYLIVDGRYYEACNKQSSSWEVILKSENSLYELLLSERLSGLKQVGFDAEKESVASLIHLKKELQAVRKLKKYSVRLLPLYRPLASIRAVKDALEIQKIKESCQLCVAGFSYITKLLKKGISEKEVARELEIFWLREGADGVAFSPIIAFGKNSSMPHYRAHDTRLQEGDIILIDIGVVLNGYSSDMTRMASLGKPHKRLQDIFSIVKHAQKIACQGCVPGKKLSDIDLLAREYITAKGYGDCFIHSLGHGLGLNVHGWPTIKKSVPPKEVLEAGMCVTIEPGIYIPRLGGVRIEDTILIESHGCQILTECSHELLIV